MSRSPLEETEDADEVGSYRDHFRVFAQMLSSGRSLSGRERNCCFLNTADGRFADVSSIAGFDFPEDGRAVALTDWDFDGDVDVWLLSRNQPRIRFLRNEVGSQQAFLSLKLTGAACNRDAIGARVEVTAQGASGKQDKTVYAGHGFATQSTKWLHFGLGAQNGIERVTVKWPGGDSQTWNNLKANTAYKLRQGDAEPTVFTAPDSAGPLAVQHTSGPRAKPNRLRIGLAGRVPTPQLRYRSWEGAATEIQFPRERPLLINLWANWCAPCLQELKEFSESHDQLAEVDILALTVDGVNDVEAEAVARAQAFLKRVEFPFDSGMATLDLGEKLRTLQSPFLEPTETAALPTSFLLSPTGDLAAIYQGPVTPIQLRADAQRILKAGDQPANLALQFPGKWRTFPTQQDHLITLAALSFTAGRPDDALVFSRHALAADPSSELAQRNVDVATSRKQEIEDNIQRFEQRLQANPNDADSYFNLGVAYRSVSNWDSAIEAFEKAIAQNPNFTEAHIEAGALYARQGNLKQAETNFRAALQVAPGNPQAKQGLEQIAATKKAAR